ncbi:MAG: TraR/DksA family transcriptional regulator [Alphaproteobacteria bacterium]|jgi:DnaK suppressor protein
MLDLNEIKTRLNARLATLGARVGDIEEDLREQSDPNFAEQALEAEGDEVLEGLEANALKEIDQINAALARIEQGAYETCTSCEEPIGTKRLEALPYATQCIKCAS